MKLNKKKKFHYLNSDFRIFSNQYFKSGLPQRLDYVTQAILDKQSQYQQQQQSTLLSGSRCTQVLIIFDFLLILQQTNAYFFPQSKKNTSSPKDTSFQRMLGKVTEKQQQNLELEKLVENDLKSQESVISNERVLGRKEFKEIANANLSAASWDCQHLDQFLGKRKSYLNVNNNHNTDYVGQEKTGRSNIVSIKSMKSNQSSSLLMSKNKLCPFTLQPRFPDISKLNKKLEFEGNYSDKNFLVPQTQEVVDSAAKNYFDNNFQIETKNFDKTSLSYNQQKSELSKPSEQLKQLREIQTAQNKFKQWEQTIFNKNRKFRSCKQQFPSGIIGIDNPENSESQIYSDEYRNMISKEDFRLKIEQRRQEQVKQLYRTNEFIEFFNKKFSINNNNNNKKENIVKIVPEWQNKGQIKEEFMRKFKSRENVICGEQKNSEYFNYGRASNILQNETRGKNYNIITSESYNPLSYSKTRTAN